MAVPQSVVDRGDEIRMLLRGHGASPNGELDDDTMQLSVVLRAKPQNLKRLAVVRVMSLRIHTTTDLAWLPF
jgi:hypothetical protein